MLSKLRFYRISALQMQFKFTLKTCLKTFFVIFEIKKIVVSLIYYIVDPQKVRFVARISA